MNYWTVKENVTFLKFSKLVEDDFNSISRILVGIYVKSEEIYFKSFLVERITW